MPAPTTVAVQRVPSPKFWAQGDDPSERVAVYSSSQVQDELATGRPFTKSSAFEQLAPWQAALRAMGFTWSLYSGVSSLRTQPHHSLRRLVRDLVFMHEHDEPNLWVVQRALMHATFLHLLNGDGVHVDAHVENIDAAAQQATRRIVTKFPRPDGELVVFDLEGPEWYVDLCGRLQVKDLGAWANGETTRLKEKNEAEERERAEERKRLEAERAVVDLGRLGENLDELERA